MVYAFKVSKSNTKNACTQGITNPHQLQVMVQHLNKRAGSHKPTLQTFGLGDDHNEEMLAAISDEYTFIENADDIAAQFAQALGSLISITSQNVEINVVPSIYAEIAGFRSAFPVQSNKVRIGDMTSQARKDFIIDLVLPATAEESRTNIMTVQLSAMNLVSGTLENSHYITLYVNRVKASPSEPADATVCIAEMRYKVAKALGDAAAKIKSGDEEEARPGLEALLEQASALVADMQARGSKTQCGIAAVLRNDVEQALQDLERGSYGSKSLLTKSACRGMQRGSVGTVDVGEDEDEEVARFCAGNSQQRALTRSARLIA